MIKKIITGIVHLICVMGVLVTTLSIVLAVFSCGDREYVHEFRQPSENIEKVEICTFDYFDYESRQILKVLTEDETETILAEISSLVGKNISLPPPDSFGKYVIAITYLNGEMELIGGYYVGYVTLKGKLRTETYTLGYKNITNIISKYYDISSATTVTTQ